MKNLYLSAALLTLLSAGYSFASEDMRDPNNWDAPDKNNKGQTLHEATDSDDEETRDLKARLAAKEKQKAANKEAAAKKAAEEALKKSTDHIDDEEQQLIDEENKIAEKRKQLKLKKEQEAAAKKAAEEATAKQDSEDVIGSLESIIKTEQQATQKAQEEAARLAQELQNERAEKEKLQLQKAEAREEYAQKQAQKAAEAKTKVEEEVRAAQAKTAQDKLAYEEAVSKALATGKSDRQSLNSTGTNAGVCLEESVINNTLFVYRIDNTNVDGQRGRIWWTYLKGGFTNGWFNLQDIANPRIENGIFKTDTPFDQINVYNRDTNKKVSFGNYFSSKSGQEGNKLQRILNF